MPSLTIRVYGIYIDEKNRVLISDEFIYGKYVTKFPGGGLQSGEGTIDCLKREMIEEAGQEAEVLSHFYTTDFFVPSAFDPTKQVISIYYTIRFKEAVRFKTSDRPFDFQKVINNAQSFRWMQISEIGDDLFTLVIDKKVGEMLKAKVGSGSF